MVKCKDCGSYVLIQQSEFLSFTDAPNGYYTDYFAVDGPDEAQELNLKNDGFQLESHFNGPHITLNR